MSTRAQPTRCPTLIFFVCCACVCVLKLLRTITFYRTPAEKARVLLEACEEVVKCASRARKLRAAAKHAGSGGGGGGGGGGGSSLGADDLLPLLVYMVIRARVASLPAELAFVADFLPEGLQHGKEGYALVSLQCACRAALDELAWGEGLLGARPDAPSSDARSDDPAPDEPAADQALEKVQSAPTATSGTTKAAEIAELS